VTRRPIWELVLAALGASFLLVVAVNRWGVGGDEHAYWLAARRLIDGQPLYDPSVTITTPYAYLYAPPLAQAMVPFALVLPAWLFDAVWTIAMLVALWWLAGRDVIRSLALVAFPPVAVEFWFRNVHLFLAVLLVLGLRQWPGWHAVGAAIKISPGLAIVYDALRGRWRAAAIGAGVGLGLLVVSVALSPEAWDQYLGFVRGIDLGQQTSFVPIPFLVRAAAAVVLVLVASRLIARRGDLLLVVAVTLALPSLWFTGLSLLTAAVPLWRRPTVDSA
jgi:hypothetical protein